jgi:hypothetical protein
MNPCRKIQGSDMADPTGWASRALLILRCPSLVAAMVAWTVIIGCLGTIGWARVNRVEESTTATKGKQDLIEQRLLAIEHMLERMDSKVDALMMRSKP